jgi:hypothetical protein
VTGGSAGGNAGGSAAGVPVATGGSGMERELGEALGRLVEAVWPFRTFLNQAVAVATLHAYKVHDEWRTREARAEHARWDARRKKG